MGQTSTIPPEPDRTQLLAAGPVPVYRVVPPVVRATAEAGIDRSVASAAATAAPHRIGSRFGRRTVTVVPVPGW